MNLKKLKHISQNNNKKDIKNKLKKIFKNMLKPNVFQFILIWYLVFIFVGAGLLMAPISVN
ncbi:hypothetical protein IKS57_04410 [bacterium]|nr:hypothetical protein [bacterium]